MSYVLKTIGKVANIPFKHFECDEVSDLSKIDVSNAPMGSTCYVINSNAWYTLNGQKQWKIRVVSSGSNSGDNSGTIPSPDDSYIYDGGEEV